jgi:hypothetical protein
LAPRSQPEPIVRLWPPWHRVKVAGGSDTRYGRARGKLCVCVGRAPQPTHRRSRRAQPTGPGAQVEGSCRPPSCLPRARRPSRKRLPGRLADKRCRRPRSCQATGCYRRDEKINPPGRFSSRRAPRRSPCLRRTVGEAGNCRQSRNRELAVLCRLQE